MHGSSPRVRGTRRLYRMSALTSPVHPRACGELIMRRSIRGNRGGSSPRVRGTRSGRRCDSCWCRFIPARAGNSDEPPVSLRSLPVHPRACGELGIRRNVLSLNSGSSPRVRGTLIPFLCILSHVRFIPARAGNSKHPCRSHQCQPVHPRACGELAELRNSARLSCGSSPRVRGTQFWRPGGEVAARFIPARAGNSLVVTH